MTYERIIDFSPRFIQPSRSVSLSPIRVGFSFMYASSTMSAVTRKILHLANHKCIFVYMLTLQVTRRVPFFMFLWTGYFEKLTFYDVT